MVADAVWGIIGLVAAGVVVWFIIRNQSHKLPEMSEDLGKAVGRFQIGREKVRQELDSLKTAPKSDH